MGVVAIGTRVTGTMGTGKGRVKCSKREMPHVPKTQGKAKKGHLKVPPT